MIYLLTNVARTHDVLLDGTIFFDNTGQKGKATLSNKKVPIELSSTCRNLQKSSPTTQFNNES